MTQLPYEEIEELVEKLHNSLDPVPALLTKLLGEGPITDELCSQLDELSDAIESAMIDHTR